MCSRLFKHYSYIKSAQSVKSSWLLPDGLYWTLNARLVPYLSLKRKPFLLLTRAQIRPDFITWWNFLTHTRAELRATSACHHISGKRTSPAAGHQRDKCLHVQGRQQPGVATARCVCFIGAPCICEPLGRPALLYDSAYQLPPPAPPRKARFWQQTARVSVIKAGKKTALLLQARKYNSPVSQRHSGQPGETGSWRLSFIHGFILLQVRRTTVFHCCIMDSWKSSLLLPSFHTLISK